MQYTVRIISCKLGGNPVSLAYPFTAYVQAANPSAAAMRFVAETPDIWKICDEYNYVVEETKTGVIRLSRRVSCNLD